MLFLLSPLLMLSLSLGCLLIQLYLYIRFSQFSRCCKQQFNQLTDQLHHHDTNLREQFILRLRDLQETCSEKFNHALQAQLTQAAALKEQLQQAFANLRARFDERQMETLKILQDTLQTGMQENRSTVKESLQDYAKTINLRLEQLITTIATQLTHLNQQVDQRLTEGFVKTNETFHDVIKRLALIDAAQQKIADLSGNIMSLQDILNDKRSRGTFGEIQLSALIRNMLPEQHFNFQHQLSNQRRVDCILFLPEPTGNIAIDAKFPLENFRLLMDTQLPDAERQQATRQFKLDIRHHIQTIAEKYILPGETANGAMMFIPAEAVFAEIHAKHTDLVEYAQQVNVWLVSPTTMMAILTTARAVLKDAATRQQVHEIQQHLRYLAEDFERFQIRMDNLAKRIAQAHHDIEQVHISSKKISQRFVQIDRAELNPRDLQTPLIPAQDVQPSDESTTTG